MAPKRKKRAAGKPKTAEPELPPELQEPEIIEGSSDAELSSYSDGESAKSAEVSGQVKEMLNKVQLEKALAAEPEKLKKPKKPRVVEEAPKAGRRDGQIYLSQLPFSVTAEVLRGDFEKFGALRLFYFHRDADGKFLGTACLFYEDPAVADKVILLDGINYKGRWIRVRRRQPRNKGPKGAGRGATTGDGKMEEEMVPGAEPGTEEPDAEGGKKKKRRLMKGKATEAKAAVKKKKKRKIAKT
ncbi:Ferredoxin--NADP reductase [Durusdinium trenchii]|uniref:Chloroplastic n=1 Tax=Durusdinium trenchii TaxID=1381693 RepID=A0ABP0NJK9_9DINO